MKKERKQLKKISKARNSFEKRDEALQCDIALEKLENRNRVLAWVASTLKSRQRYHDQINYHFTFQELNNRIKEIEIDLKDSYQKLDLCSSKMVLNNNLRGDNEKFVLKTMLVACMGTFSVIFPLPFIISYNIGVFSFLLPFALASLTSCIYVIKRKFENKKIIRKYSNCNLEEYDFKKELAIENECMLNIREAEIKLQEYLSLLNDNQLKEEQSYEDHSQKVVSRPSVFEQTFEDGVLKEEKGFVKCLRR